MTCIKCRHKCCIGSEALTLTMVAGHVQGKYYLFNNLGQIFRSGSTDGKVTKFDISEIVNGLYYLAVKLPDGSQSTTKIIVQH